MMEHIDDDEYFQKQLESKSSVKRKQDLASSSISPLPLDQGLSKKQRSVDDYCDDADLIK